MSLSPRVLLCSFDVIPSPTGSSRRLLDYLRGLQDHFPTDVMSVKTPDHSHIERLHGARLLRVPVGSGDFASRIQAFERAVRRQLESEDYGIVHFTDPFGGYVLCEARAEHDYRLVYDALAFPSHELRFTHPHLEGDRRFLARVRRQELFCLLNADAVITGSHVTRDFLLGLGVEEDSIQLLPTASDLDGVVHQVRRPLPGGPLRVAYVGSQVGWQGLTTLVRAVAHAAKQVDVRLTLVGPRHPDWQPHLESLAAELSISERIEFHAPVAHAEVGKVLAAADVCVVPLDDVERNRSPGGPVGKIADYLAAGRAILSVDLPLTRELLPETCTRFVPPRDPQAMGEALISLAKDPARRREMGAESRKLAESTRSPSDFRARIRALYGALLDRKAGASAPTESGAVTPPPSPEVAPVQDREPTIVAEPEPHFDESAFAPTVIRKVPLPPSSEGSARSSGETRRAPALTSRPVPKGPSRSAGLLEDEPTFADASPLNGVLRADEEDAPTSTELPPASRPASPQSARSPAIPPLSRAATETRKADAEAPSTARTSAAPAAPLRTSTEAHKTGTESVVAATRPLSVSAPTRAEVLASTSPSEPRVTSRRSTPSEAPRNAADSSLPLTGPNNSPPPLTGPNASPPPITGPSASPPPIAGPSASPPPITGPSASPPPITGPSTSPLPLSRSAPVLPAKPPAPRITTAHFEAASTLLPPPLPPSASTANRPRGSAAVVTTFPPAVPVRPSKLLIEALKAIGAPLPPATTAPAMPMLVGDDDVEEITGEGEPALLDEGLEGEAGLQPLEAEASSRLEEVLDEVLEDVASPVDEGAIEPADDAVLLDSQTESPPAEVQPPAPGQVTEAPDAEELDDSAYVESEATRSLPPCSLAPWLAQLLHGYCPPEGIDFNRPPPPTTFPGRDESPTPPSPRLSPGSSGTNLT